MAFIGQPMEAIPGGKCTTVCRHDGTGAKSESRPTTRLNHRSDHYFLYCSAEGEPAETSPSHSGYTHKLHRKNQTGKEVSPRLPYRLPL